MTKRLSLSDAKPTQIEQWTDWSIRATFQACSFEQREHSHPDFRITIDTELLATKYTNLGFDLHVIFPKVGDKTEWMQKADVLFDRVLRDIPEAERIARTLSEFRFPQFSFGSEDFLMHRRLAIREIDIYPNNGEASCFFEFSDGKFDTQYTHHDTRTELSYDNDPFLMSFHVRWDSDGIRADKENQSE